MCGITGIISFDRERTVERITLEAMTQALAHRGPDDQGIYVEGPIGLGQRRLSIIDLSGGHQPLFSVDGRLAIVFNGEIYNFQELKQELDVLGHHFQTHSDTEVILEAFRAWGTACVERFNGMFTFALWDREARTVFLATDRYGKKPLYYTVHDGQVFFASELKGLLTIPGLPKEVDPKAVLTYLSRDYVPAPLSIFRGIQKFPQASRFLLAYDRPHNLDDIRPERYWRISIIPEESLTFQEACAGVRRHLHEAVQRRLMSEVPLGVFLSGGIDSSAVVAFMADMMPSKDIKTFSIGFDDASYDETRYARMVAKRFQTDHREEILSPLVLLDLVPGASDTLDEPFADPSFFPTFLLARFTRRYVTVALGGDGGDELFAGYTAFRAHRLGDALDRLPSWAREGMFAALRQAPLIRGNSARLFRLEQYRAGLAYPRPIRHQVWLGTFGPEALKGLLHPEQRRGLEAETLYGDLVANDRDRLAWDGMDRVIAQYTETYLTGDILVKVDRASMANSLEVRAPFLDPELTAFLGRLPSSWKIRGLTGKHLLKESLRDKLPHEVLFRKKQGFGIPVAQWFRGELLSTLEELFSERALKEGGWFDPKVVRTLLAEHASGAKDHRKFLWSLFMFELWRKRWA